jgi:hypothetical protein
MLFQQLVNRISPQQVCSRLVLKQVVTMLFQQLVNKMHPQLVCSWLVNKLWQCCFNNLSTGSLLNRSVAGLLASCDNAVPTTCQQVVMSRTDAQNGVDRTSSLKMPSFLWQGNLPNWASKIKRLLARHMIFTCPGQVLSYNSVTQNKKQSLCCIVPNVSNQLTPETFSRQGESAGAQWVNI